MDVLFFFTTIQIARTNLPVFRSRYSMSHDNDHSHDKACNHDNGRNHDLNHNHIRYHDRDYNQGRDHIDGLAAGCAVNRDGHDLVGSEGRLVDRGRRRWFGRRHRGRYLCGLYRRHRFSRRRARHGVLPQGEVRYGGHNVRLYCMHFFVFMYTF